MKKLSGRDEKKRELDSVLTSLGGSIGNVTSSDLSMEQELKIYDAKVHKACQKMQEATEKELARMQVPFFCTETGKIEEGQLRELQQKMTALLIDLCKDEKEEK